MTLIAASSMAQVLDQITTTFNLQVPATDQGGADIITLAQSLYATGSAVSPIFPDPADIQQANDYFTALNGMVVASSSGTPLGVFTSTSQQGFAASTTGQLTRAVDAKYKFRSILQSLDNLVTSYSAGTYTTLVGYLAGTGLQVSVGFANLYWLVRGIQIAPANVFAPTSVNLSTYVVTGTCAGTLTAGAFPTTNGYTVPAPTVDAFGYNSYVGQAYSAQGFAPVHAGKVHITTNINGTLALTATFTNQNGLSHTWSGTLDNATAGTDISLTANTGGDYINSVCTAISFTGTVTAGAWGFHPIALR